MDEKEMAFIIQKLFGMVASVEQASAAVVDLLVLNGVIDRDILLKGLIEKRDALDPKFSRSGFDNLIAALAPTASTEKH